METDPRVTHRLAPDQALADIIQRIPDRAPMTVADLGCAQGERLPLLAAHFGEVLAVSTTDAGMEAARRACPDDNVRYTVADLGDLSSLRGQIDVVLAMDVEVLPDATPLDRLIEQAHGVLVEGGILLLGVPAAKRIGGPVELRLGRVAPRNPRRAFHEVELQYLVRRAGFQGLRIRRFEATAEGGGRLLCMAVRRAMN